MQVDILKSIDNLADMADATDNIETLEAEINEIERRSSKLKKELNFYNDILPEEKYYRASERLVDENLKASLEIKIKKQEQALEDLQNELKDDLKIEKELHEQKETLETKIAETNDYIKILKLRDTKEYLDLVKIQEKKLNDLYNDLEKTKNDYKIIGDKIDILNLAKEEREEKLQKEKEKLKDTKACLINPTSYIDYDMQKIDEVRMAEIKEELLNLDKRRIEILTDPAMIAKDAKNLILDDDRTSALAKIKELVTIVKTKPYMDIPNGTELTNILQEELVTASEKRDEFAAIIENKDYMGTINSVINERLNFLNYEIDYLKEEIQNLKTKIKKIDEENLKEVLQKKENVSNYYEELEQQIIVYEDMLKGDDSDKSPKRKAILNTALIKKQDELKIVEDILNDYANDERSLVMKVNKLLELIKDKESQITEIETKITEFNKLIINSSKIKDVLAIETDKRKLKELDDKVKDIQHRQKYDQTPSEIFDEIEIYFGTLDSNNVKENIEDDKVNIENSEDSELVDYTLENDELDEKEITNYLDETDDLELKTEDDKNYDSFVKNDDDFVIEKFDMTDYSDIENKNQDKTEERKKVIKVEKLNKETNNWESEDDFIIGDYKDDDYLDMSSLFNDDNNGVL